MVGIKDFLKVYWPFLAGAVVLLAIAASFIEPAPPNTVRFATGSSGGAYYAYGERYRALLAEEGVTVELIETAGTIDNFRLLEEGAADVALLQGGLAKPSDAEVLASLGGLFYEPFWVFVREDSDLVEFGQLRDRRFAIGADGSGTRALALQMQGEFGGLWADSARQPLSGKSAAQALEAGQLDGAAFAAGIEAPYIQALLTSPGVRLLAFDRAPALSRRSSALAAVPLLQGVIDVGANVPSREVPLVAAVAQLGVRQDLHPALQSLLVDAASAIHSEGSYLAPAGSFPDAAQTDLPITRQATRYYRNGPSALRRYFSFSMANFLERAWILAIPLLTLMFPLVRAAPPIYRWRVRRKIYVWYDDLRALEERGRAATDQSDVMAVHRELEALQVDIGTLDVPLSYTDDLYRLRSHVQFVKHLIEGTEAQPGELA